MQTERERERERVDFIIKFEHIFMVNLAAESDRERKRTSERLIPIITKSHRKLRSPHGAHSNP